MEQHEHYITKGKYIQYDFHKTLDYLTKFGINPFGLNFQFFPEDLEILKRLFVYNIDDSKNCKEFGLDLSKGILLIGPVGCGKTSLMQVFNHLAHEHKKYVVRPSREINTEFLQDGFQVLQKYGKSDKIYCFDDLGIEQSFKHFGNECNVLAEILLTRHASMRMNKTITHATTNLNADELEKIYGNRVRSRLREMFNLITFPSNTPDKRK